MLNRIVTPGVPASGAARPDISVVIATYNRPAGVVALLQDLEVQDGMRAGGYEVIVVDDGSRVPVKPEIDALQLSYPCHVIEQANGGQAAARHQGLLASHAELVVILDDDMRVPASFLKAHWDAHRAGADVLQGAIHPADMQMPLFERWHARELQRFADAILDGRIVLRGAHIATGNVSIRRSQYFAIGGFDLSMKRSEDRDLGVRLERAGAKLRLGADAYSVHHTDHTSLEVWLGRAFNYGVYDSRICAKHPDLDYVDPWHFLFAVNPVSRPVFLLVTLWPAIGRLLSGSAMRVAQAFDSAGVTRIGMAGTAFAYGVEYFRGMRADAGSARDALRRLRRYLQNRARNRAPSVHGVPVAGT